MYDFSSFPAAILFFQVMESMDDFNNTTIDLVDLENMGVPVGISCLSGVEPEIQVQSQLTPFGGARLFFSRRF